MRSSWKNAARRTLSALLVCVLLVGCMGVTSLAAAATDDAPAQTELPELRLWYNKPASQSSLRGDSGSGINQGDENDYWQKNTLPIGNGDLGANVYGEIGTERLTLNEKTLWNGGPSASRPNYIGGNLAERGKYGEQLNLVRQLYFTNQSADTINSATNLLTGEGSGPYGTYLTWGELNIATGGLTNTSAVTGYERWLSLDDALAGVKFTSGGVTYTREYLMSNPDNVLAVKLTASQSQTFTVSLPGKMPGTVTTATVVGNDTLKLCGQLSDNEEKYASFLKAVPGAETTVSGSGSNLTVTGTEVTLFFSAATDYKAVFPTYRNGETDAELAARVKAVVDAAAAKGYDAVKADHLRDYHGLFDRVNVDLGQTDTDKPTDELILAYKNGSATTGEERLLEMMIFQYGRYLTIAASRENSILPTNLQGVWNNRNNPPWMSDYHTNVNLEINYWPTYSTNLAECADPLVRFVESLREPGRITAHIYAGIESTPENPENGFMAHTQTTPYGYTTPGWIFSWGWSPASIAWLLQNCWEHYEYTGDLDYMRNNIYPMMREYCRFYDQFLFDSVSGKTADKLTPAEAKVAVLTSTPAYSPETGPRTMGNTFEHSLIWQLYEDTMTAAKLLGVDSDRIGDEDTPGTWLYNQSHLQGPIEVGASGQVKEWYNEVSLDASGKALDANGNDLGSEGYTHRHISHMVGIYPGDLIQSNEEWIEAARVSMNNRNDENTGWSMTHRVNVWARLRDGNHAHKVLSLMVKGDKFYNNLWDTHSPFQIDGNFGYTAGVSEMLLQSNMGFIDLLPALPDAWANGSYKGLIARGNFETSAAWTGGALQRASITSKNGGECVVNYPNLSRAVVKDSADNLIEFEVIDNDKISFPTAKGQTYTITEIPASRFTLAENAEALRTATDSVTVRWTAEDGTAYQVYRQVAGGDILPVGDSVTEGHFVDDAAYEDMGEIKYYIQAEDCELSDAINVQDLRNMSRVDDQYSLDGTNPNGTPIIYSGSWGTYNNHDTGDYKETCKFVEAGSVNGQTATLTFLGTGIQAKGRGYATQFTMAIDGGAAQSFTSANSAARDQVLGQITDLEYGIHTVVLTLTANKIDFDGFNVLGGVPEETPGDPEELKIDTVGGVEKLWNAGDTVQFTANLEGVTWTTESTVTHATTCNYPEHKYSWNASTQTLTAGLTDEEVTVTATKGSQTASKTITITPKTTVTIIEDSVSHSGNTGPLNPDPNITSSGSWSAWWGEQTKHHGGSKVECSTVGAWLQLTFEGTDVAVYGTIHFNNGAVSVLLDGEAQDDIHPCGDSGSTDLAQRKLAEYTGLTNGTHTLKLTVKAANNAAGASKTNFALDFFEVHAPNPNAPQADLEDLQAAVAEAAAYSEASYTEESWAPLAAALATAGEYLNNTVNATQEQADATAADIRAAIKGLDPKPLAAPENVKAILVEGTAVTLKWDAVIGATGYEITVGGETYETTATTYRVTGLNSGEEYTFTVKAVNAASEEVSPASDEVTVTTLDTVAPDKPANLTWDGNNTLSWDDASDNVGVVGYKVLLNGEQQGELQTATSTTLTLSGQQNSLAVIAVDAAGNESVPATLVVAPTYTVTVTNATIQGDKTRFKVGEAVTVTADVPETGSILTGWTVTGVTLSDEDKTAQTVTFSMPAGNVSLAATVEEKNWSVTAELTNLYSNLGANRTVPHGEGLTVTLTAMAPYQLPTSVQVIMGGRQLQSPWVTYSVADGEITIREVTGEVTIIAENAPQTPTGTVFTAADPFQLPTNEGDSTKLEAEYMELVPVNGSSLAAVYGPNFGNQQLTGFVSGDKIKLYYNAEYAGTYTLTLRYLSNATANAHHEFNWAGGNVEEHVGAVESTLEDGTAIYRTAEMEFTVTEEGPGMVEFSTGKDGGPAIDSMTFTLDQISATYVEEITLDKTELTLFLSGDAGEDSATLTATEITPADATNKDLRWSSSDSSVAYVSQEGLVIARNNGTATITATAMDGHGAVARATVTVKTRITGEVSISGVPQYGQDLVASVNQISNQNAQDTLTYQWNRDGDPIDGATDRHYTVAKEDIGHALTVTAFATDPYVGADGGAISDPVTATQAEGPDVTDTLDATDFTATENGKIIGLNATTNYQYKLVGENGDAWADIPAGSTDFEVPAPGSYHVRVAASKDDTTAAGAPSSALTILAADATGDPITIVSAAGGTVRADVNKANAGATVTLTVLPKTGYQLVAGSLEVNGGDVTVHDNDGVLTFEMPAGAATVTASFELKTYTIAHNLTHINCDLETHEATHGEKPIIIAFTPDDGFDLPQVVTVTVTETGAPFTAYTYDEGRIIFDGGITANLTIDGVGIKKSFPVIYALYGLSSADGARSVEYHDALTFTITPKQSYTLPSEIFITMDGKEFTQFTYVPADGTATVTIEEGKITGEIAITAEGTSELPSLVLVEIEGTAVVGRTLRAVPTPANVFPDYRWLRVDSEGNEYPIYGATNRTYVITADDEGFAIKVAATGAGIKFGNTIYSEPTQVVENVNIVATTGVTLNRTAATITVGGNPIQLAATVLPADASNKAVTWKSSDEAVAFVTSNGAVSGRSPGTATITVTTVNGGKTATCTVTVVAITLPPTASVTLGKTITLTPTIPDDLADKTITWTSDNEDIATVEDGVVTGVALGKANITATTGDGYTATCEVTVSKASAPAAPATPAPTTAVKENEDGSVTTTVTDPDGTVTVTTEWPDGAKVEKVTDPEEGVSITATDAEGETLAEVKVPALIPETDKRFEDVPVGHWADKAIHQLAAIEVVNGVTDTTYSPVAPMKRGDLATVLYRLSNKPAGGELSFEDVPESKYYADGIAWAAKVGVVEGFTEEEFQPETVITREQLALMLLRYAKLLGMDTGADAEVLEAYADGSATHAWAVNGMAWCVKNGILQGRSEDTLAPTSNVTRAEVAVMIDRFLGLVK